MTVYINPVNYYDPAGKETTAEIRVETDDLGQGAVIALGTFDYDNGDELGNIELDRGRATELRDALTAVLEGN